MIMVARCGDCRKPYRVDRKYAGMTVRCKACGGAVVVPAGTVPVVLPAGLAPVMGDAPAPSPAEASSDPGRSLPLAPPPLPTTHRRPVTPELDPAPPRRPAAPAIRRVAPARAREAEDVYVRFPGEQLVDRLVPLGALAGLLVALVWPIVMKLHAVHGVAKLWGKELPEGTVGTIVGQYAKFLAVLVPVGVMLPTGLLCLAVFLASKVMQFRRPDSLFVRAATVVCAPIAVQAVIFGMAMQQNGLEMPAGQWVLVSAGLWLGVMWLMFPLRPGTFGVTIAFSLVLAVAVPLFVLMVLALIAGFRLALPSFGGRAPIRPSPPAISPAPPMHLPAPPEPLTAARPPRWSPPVSPPRAGSEPARGTPAPPDSGDVIWYADAAPQAAPPAPGGGGGAVDRGPIEAALARIGRAARAYADAHDGKYPPDLRTLQAAGLLEEGDLRSPGVSRPYLYFGSMLRSQSPPPAAYVLAYDVAGSADGRRTILFGDGRVETIPLSKFGDVMHASGMARLEMMRGR